MMWRKSSPSGPLTVPSAVPATLRSLWSFLGLEEPSGAMSWGQGGGYGAASLRRCPMGMGCGAARPQAGSKMSRSKAATGRCDPVKLTCVNTFWVVNHFQSGGLSPHLPLAAAHPSPSPIPLEAEGFFTAVKGRVEEQQFFN